jgi:RNA ligase
MGSGWFEQTHQSAQPQHGIHTIANGGTFHGGKHGTNIQIYKYPRTHHIQGSRSQPGDEDLNTIPFTQIANRPVIVEEKVDGANAAISFDSSGNLRLQSRGHYLAGGPRERHFNLFKQWASVHTQALWDVLGDCYILYGEWLYAKHTVFYDALPHYFLEYDLLDLTNGQFLSLCQENGLDIAISRHQTDSSSLMEGLYIKVEEDGLVQARYKYVRSDFLTTILQSESHWLSRPIIPNQLQATVDLFAVA